MTSPAAQAFGLGVVAGLRSQMPLALLSLDAARHPERLADTPLAFFAAAPVAPLWTLGAVGELVLDKTPFLPDRIAPAPLLGRVICGALAGAVVCAAQRRPLLLGAALGAGGAIVGSHAGYRLRGWLTRPLGVPNLPAGLIEDGLTIALGRWLVGG